LAKSLLIQLKIMSKQPLNRAWISSLLMTWCAAAIVMATIPGVRINSLGAERLHPDKSDLSEVQPRIPHGGNFQSSQQPKSLDLERSRIEQLTQADYSDFLRFEKVRDGKGLLSAATSLNSRWSSENPDGYVRVIASAAVMLLRHSQSGYLLAGDAEVGPVVASFGSNVLNRLSNVSLAAAGRAMFQLCLDVGDERDGGKVVADVVAREAVLNPYLSLLNRIESRMAVSATNAWDVFTKEEQRNLKSGVPPSTLGGVAVSEREIEDRLFNIRELIRDHEMFGPPGTNNVRAGFSDWQRRLEGAFAAFLHRRYSDSDDDLDEVQQALDKHLVVPGLKERIILAAYNGTNPFAGRQLSASTKIASPEFAAVVKPPKAPTKQVPPHTKTDVSATLPAKSPNSGVHTWPERLDVATLSVSERSLPYLPLAGVLASGMFLWWFMFRSRSG
jgi:hypothetical protein